MPEKTCIRVIDDGRGMWKRMPSMAFERHATSKIREAADLFTSYHGLSWEALASIAAVAQVELKTCSSDDGLGTFIQISVPFAGRKAGGSSLPARQSTSLKICSSPFACREVPEINQTELSNIGS